MSFWGPPRQPDQKTKHLIFDLKGDSKSEKIEAICYLSLCFFYIPYLQKRLSVICHSVFFTSVTYRRGNSSFQFYCQFLFSHLLQKMRHRFVNLLAIITLVLLFFSFYRPSANPSYDDSSVNPPTIPGDRQLQISHNSAYPCPVCDYPPWLVEFLWKRF